MSKYIVASLILVGIVLTPAYLARANGKKGIEMVTIRLYSWLLCWTGIFWIFALYMAVKK